MTLPAGGVSLVLSRHLKVTGLTEALRSELIRTFTLTNPRWLENERMGRFNRDTPKTLRYYRQAGRAGLVLPRGYTRRMMEWLRADGIGYELKDRRRELPPAGMAFSGVLKPFQETAAQRMLAKEFGTLCAPTGSGKTVIALFMIAQRRQPTVIMVHTRELAMQWMRQITAFLGIPEEEIGLIGAGKNRPGGKVTVAMVQSLYKCAKAVSSGCGHIVVDECHRAPARTFTEALSAFDARYMLGLSATPWRRDKLSKLIFWYLGDVRHEVASSGLVEAGHVLAADIVYRETEFQPFHDPVREYSRMLAELTADDKRNRMIAADVAQQIAEAQGTCLVLTDRKAHADTLNSILHYKHHLASALLTGDLGAGERRVVLERLAAGRIDVLVATGQLIGEGFDCPNLSVLFLATPVRFSGRLLQYLGRVLRPAPGKHRARVYDYVDARVEVLAAAARARQRVYERGGSSA
jgi:superfamily II DNA or RNA helicase